MAVFSETGVVGVADSWFCFGLACAFAIPSPLTNQLTAIAGGNSAFLIVCNRTFDMITITMPFNGTATRGWLRISAFLHSIGCPFLHHMSSSPSPNTNHLFLQSMESPLSSFLIGDSRRATCIPPFGTSDSTQRVAECGVPFLVSLLLLSVP
ncbi:hypothetical protein T440DRAFT_137580 [Plenodomus tracheiphilus IPT5]|uniref:Uncharacterized protein n=1 Tax=Plenodomus tracheiphilus IPT5 TaxID=1408161 RepID=A0A6A7B413_9PLEO|nr:hypothetical protein T440DRAFT_137580 [Plenodomus tracheiphilus IPT5]